MLAVMARAKHPSNKRPTQGSKTFAPPPPPEAFGSSPVPASDDQVKTSSFSLHDLFAQQARAMLDRTDLDEEQKQNVLVAMSCPCCGAGGLSFTAKLKRRK
jgi:hypothetical protein